MNAQAQFRFYIIASFGGNNDALVFCLWLKIALLRVVGCCSIYTM